MDNSKRSHAALVAAFGEALWDLLPSGPVLGGAPLNFAYRIKCLGHRGVMISQLGNDDFGDRALEQIRALGMETGFIHRTSAYPTGTVDVALDEHKSPIFTIIPNVAYDHISYTADMDELVRQAGCLCFGTVAQRSEISRKTLAKLLAEFAGQYALFDINLRKDCYTPEVVKASISRSTILKLNEHEILIVAEMYGLPGKIIPELVDGLLRKTALQDCLVTLGKYGAFAASKTGEQVYEPTYKITVVDTCGSGDAFTAGFLCALLENQGLRAACKFGNALGAMVAEQPGATQPITREEVVRFMQEREPGEVEPTFKAYI